jgi:hypothetical protein
VSGRLGGTLEALTPIAVPVLPAAQALPEDPGTLDDVDALAQRTDALCSAAVDPWEIAAGLEAEGINDAVASASYGHPDVFSLADELYKRVPRRVAATAPAPNPWNSRPGHHLLRGFLFGMPGLCYVAASGSLSAAGAVAATVLSLLLSWSVSEALSYLGYVRLGRGDRAGSAWLLRTGFTAGLAVLVPITVAAGFAFSAGTTGTVFAVAQSVYLLAATVVLVSGAERRLLLALAPGVMGSVAHLAVGGPMAVLWVTGGVTVLGTSGLALWLTRRAARPTVSGADLRSAAPHAAWGLLAGGLLTFTTIAALLGPAGARGPILAGAVVTLPLSLSMGAAEWLLHCYRRRMHDLLVATTSLARFRRRAHWALAGTVGWYLVVLALLAGVLAWLGQHTGAFTLTPILFWTSVALGSALFTALALRSCGVLGAVLLACTAALGGEAAVWAVRIQPDIQIVQLTACGLLAAGLLLYALVALGRATRHR